MAVDAAGAKRSQVRERLDALIESLLPGEAIPAERELARELGVARMTLRRAVDELIVERKLVRRHGSGTFVAPSQVAKPLSATSFSDDMRARGLRPGSRTVAWRQVPASLAYAALLEISPHATILNVRRLRLADDIPMAIEDLSVPQDLVPGLTGEELQDASFYQLLSERFGVTIRSGQQVIEPCLVEAADAALLDVPEGDPAFCFERTSRTSDGRVAEFVRSIYRGDRYRIVAPIFPEPIV
ncbi:GntR family transcriptional regulator [Solicola gregarius]|uniref:GntR family transcriptional regulator n=1 Tax=Solicola gregarius TaxID=2908642 RepID=A0AA46TE03_9ACTN|nr:GntR family transcriptional regulator [Solicola gregarius]UYM03460.1 GntR family transcriptional regulator [Solicola gregarius]